MGELIPIIISQDTNVKSFCCTPKTKAMLCFNFISTFKIKMLIKHFKKKRKAWDSRAKRDYSLTSVLKMTKQGRLGGSVG